MNQFKKAKQLRSETGQAIESITDLKTAGVIQKEKNTEPSITEEKKVQPNNTSTDILSNSRIIENTTLTTNVESTADNTNTDIDANIQTTVQSITETKPKESVLLSAQTPDNTTTVAPVVIEQPITKPTETITYNHPVPQTEAAVIEQPETSYETVTEHIIPVAAPELLNTPDVPVAISQTVSAPVPITGQPAMPTYTTPTEYSNISQAIQQPYIEPQPSQEATAIKHSKSSRKSVPNIFAPKGEAKSMRKSLVLKPTSVKIAENYCEKNGGSFNELIQTLLDNFIDEYGL